MEASISEDKIDSLIEILLWFGFLGVIRNSDGVAQETYIYNVFYDMKKLKRLTDKLRNENIKFCIHCAFWPFLEIDGDACPI